MVRYLSILLFFSLLVPFQLHAQEEKEGPVMLEVHIEDGDTLPYYHLPEYNYYSQSKWSTKKQRRRWNKLVRNVVKTYPYARITADLLEYYEEELAKIEDEEKRQEFMKSSEEVLKDEFRGEMMNMTISQGRVLVKLIDRETGQTSYELIKELRNGFTAFMYNSLASLFGNSLKATYDPVDDADIETVVQMIERGEIQVVWRDAATAKARADLSKKERKALKKKNKKAERDAKKSI